MRRIVLLTVLLLPGGVVTASPVKEEMVLNCGSPPRNGLGTRSFGSATVGRENADPLPALQVAVPPSPPRETTPFVTVFRHICEFPHLDHVLRYHAVTTSPGIPGSPRGACTLLDFPFGNARFEFELVPEPGENEVWLVDDAAGPWERFERPALRIRAEPDVLVIEPRGGAPRRYAVEMRPEVPLVLQVTAGSIALRFPGIPSSFHDVPMTVGKTFRFALPTSGATCEECGVAKLDLAIPASDVSNWSAALAASAPDVTIEGLERMVNFARVQNGAVVPGLAEVDGGAGADEPDSPLEVTRFELPLVGGACRVELVQVIDGSNWRIPRVWWVVYVDGRRTDAWSHRPDPADNSEGKWPAPYEITGVEIDERVVLHTSGEMARPGGRGWMQSKDLHFRRDRRTLHFDHVVGLALLTYDFEKDEVSATAESASDGTPEVLVSRSTTANLAVAEACGLSADDDRATARRKLPAIVACLLERGPVETRRRSVHDPSWFERGGP